MPLIEAHLLLLRLLLDHVATMRVHLQCILGARWVVQVDTRADISIEQHVSTRLVEGVRCSHENKQDRETMADLEELASPFIAKQRRKLEVAFDEFLRVLDVMFFCCSCMSAQPVLA